VGYVSRTRIAGTTLTVLAVGLTREAMTDQVAVLAEQVAMSPSFYRNAPVLLNITAATHFGDAEEFRALKRAIEQLDLFPVGIQGGSNEQRASALNAGLPAFPTGASAGLRTERARQSEAPAEPPPRVAPEPVAASAPATTSASGGVRARVVSQPVRSGAQVYAKGTDLIVLGAVGAGAEVIADGHVHIYGPLRGRAIAGALGDRDARIFCRALEAELIAVGGRYMVHDDLPREVRGKPVMVVLESDRLAIREM
jgi:septum site-determining protein MinC